ncbi:MAG: MFS transporter [Chlorogloeopsis fritschii C42_A2020_084]|uniref:MFS transporter n=1 Tax=Chlorogloeopsis fritschii TaxID=1124 RepID=UPI001A0167FE|nr:MFS transporter [Chlorogloeopsis fritschii]MBF2006754.1 MFS transporter [Chlorogloeopsis fritschii C42_A2020_084]
MSNSKVTLWKPLTVRNFLLLYIGETVSLLGDQFYIVALPWLTIQLTNSGITLGTVLMSAAIPRAVLMLFGGVVSDRFSPRLVMLVSNALRGLLVVLFATILALKMTQLWHIYFFAAGFGIFDGFFIPASKSIIPSLVSKEQLIASNTLSQGTSQLILLIGPALGGLLIATAGIEVAFVIDGITFAITTITLLLMKGTTAKATALNGELNQNSTSTKKTMNLIAGMREGFYYAWHNQPLRIFLLVMVILNFLFIGPLQVGMTSLAHSRFPGGAVALGILQSAWGGGGLIGTLTPQFVKNLPNIGVLLLTIASVQGFGLFLLGFIGNIALASITIAVLGFCSCIFTVVGITWIQKQTQPEMLGRVMSLGMFSAFGIAPVSFALAGLLVNLNLTIMFTVAGSIMLITSLCLAANPSVRKIS